MTNEPDAGQTPATVADLATTPQVLDDHEMTLIGLVGGDQGFRALVRLRGGRIKQVTPGTQIAWGRVVAIDEKGILFQRNGETRRITLPGS
ncbi:hypothetical protein [Antarcticimicrobium sediminis]|uniref:Type IV pilus biogenesis n=1 Tax=Antarcticimicrobium sediminis TaxID=2546227 RepID=A0A4R5F133_9RHOB|nr:hypothetical protein [Antarcticimicrobium sediminis]TDE40807.1 hypothetical protein E1B25_00890 [Antarcticimicrobium sediminis]